MKTCFKLLLALLVVTNVYCHESDSHSGSEEYGRDGLVLTQEYVDSLGVCKSHAKILDLRYLNIIAIENNAFQNCEYLIKLELSYNRIRKIKANAFNGLFSLLELSLEFNQIEFIAPNAFDALINVKKFNINNNLLKVFDAITFNAMINLVELYCAHNNIKNVNWDFIFNPKLEVLDFKSNEISVISRCNGTITEACPNPDGPIPIDFKIRVLDLANNKIKYISEFDFYVCRRLEILILSHNKIEAIHSKAFTYNGAIVGLKLDNNKLKDLEPNTFSCICQVDQCYIECLSTSLPCQMQMNYLNLANNEFKKVKKHYFQHLRHLVKLTMSYNQIEEIENDSFVNNKELIDLKLDYNRIQTITKETFKGLFNMKFLDLSFNSISYIHEGALYFSSDLKKVCLYSNPITKDYDVVKYLCTQKNNPHCNVQVDKPCTCNE